MRQPNNKHSLNAKAWMTQWKLDRFTRGLNLSDVKCVATQPRTDGATTCIAILNDGREVVLYD